MAKIPSKVTKRVRLDFKGAKGELKEKMKREAGELYVEGILRKLQQSKSPVKKGRYKKTKKDKGPADLFEDGDLYASVTFEEYRDGVEVGVFEPDQVGKAYGHNTGFRGHPTIPPDKYTREFIPKKDQDFRNDIQSAVERRLKELARKKDKKKI